MENRRRSSLRKLNNKGSKSTNDEGSGKRRISFNNRKSIREFDYEEKIVLDYELSDAKSDGTTPPNEQTLKPTRTTVLKYNDTSTQNASNVDTGSEQTTRETLEYINKSIHNTVLNFECSNDITLFDNEYHLRENREELSRKSKILNRTNGPCDIVEETSNFSKIAELCHKEQSCIHSDEDEQKTCASVWDKSDILLDATSTDHKKIEDTQYLQIMEQTLNKTDAAVSRYGVEDMDITLCSSTETFKDKCINENVVNSVQVSARKFCDSIYKADSMEIDVDCINRDTSIQETNDTVKTIYDNNITPSPTSSTQKTLRKTLAVTPSRSLVEFINLEKTILTPLLLDLKKNKTRLTFENIQEEESITKQNTLYSSFKMDMSGLELYDSNLMQIKNIEVTNSSRNHTLVHLDENIEMSILNCSNVNDSSVQELRKQSSNRLNRLLLDIQQISDSLQSVKNCCDDSVTILDVSKHLIDYNHCNTSNIFNESSLAKSFKEENIENIEEAYISLISTIDIEYEKDETEYLKKEQCCQENDVKEISNHLNSSKDNNMTYTKLNPSKHYEEAENEGNMTYNENDTSPLPNISPLPSPCLKYPTLNFEKLDHIRKYLRLTDIRDMWRRMSLNSTVNITSLPELQFEDESENIDKTQIIEKPKIWKKYEEEISRFEAGLEQMCTSVMDKLEILLGNEPKLKQWIFDRGYEVCGVCMFMHQKLLTFKLRIVYEELCPFGSKIRINDIQCDRRVKQSMWKPIDYILDFQLKMEQQENNLTNLCKGDGADNICEMLQSLQQSIETVLKLGNKLQQIVIKHGALLKVDTAERHLLRKVVRRIVPSPETYDRVEMIEFDISIYNICDINYRNILRPLLYNFHDIIESLPTGLDFLDEFLSDPVKFLKAELVDSLFNEC